MNQGLKAAGIEDVEDTMTIDLKGGSLLILPAMASPIVVKTFDGWPAAYYSTGFKVLISLCTELSFEKFSKTADWCSSSKPTNSPVPFHKSRSRFPDPPH